ncbi:MAG: sigma-70 family RNA polymerase sigma factor [Bacteroidales bacterium]|jgi:RNA polymerase sigma-70 factor (ECF subfamily)|nr:sigma-70 family RNA polymerase sigma factor [Bacteroidales bacterium]
MDNEEALLIEGCKDGNHQAQKMLYERYAPAMMSVCQRYTGNKDTARDLLHDGFVRLYTKIHTYSGAGSFGGWMRKVFVTTALEYLRRNDALKNSVDIDNADVLGIESADVSAVEQLSADELFVCIMRLPDGYRTVFNLYAVEGYSYAEIAKELHLRESSIRSQYARARQMLQRILLSKFEYDYIAK